MPRFHFNVNDGSGFVDHNGTELPDWTTARITAIKLAGEILRDNPESALSREGWHLEVTNDTGLVLLRLDLGLTEAPAMRIAKAPRLSVVARS